MLNSSTIRPGLLVMLSTEIKGNVSYEKQQLEHYTDGQLDVAEWNTKRTIQDAEELELAKQARGRASTIIRKPCAKSKFGLLCPLDKRDDLAEAIEAARKVASEFNATSRLTRVDVYVITGEVAQDDVEAVRAINSEMRGLIDAMAEGVKRMDAEAIREAANRARDVGNMLSADAQTKIKTAIDAARKVAREVSRAGEQASFIIDQAAINKITAQRTAFLDLEEPATVQPIADEAGRAVDFEPDQDDDAAPMASSEAYGATIQLEL